MCRKIVRIPCHYTLYIKLHGVRVIRSRELYGGCDPYMCILWYVQQGIVQFQYNNWNINKL